MPRKSTISPKIVTGVYFNSTYAEDAISRLLSAGFPKESLSVIGGDNDDIRQISYPLIGAGPDMYLIYCSIAGAILGAVSAWIAMTFLPGLRFFLGVIPLLASIAGAAAGSYIGFLVGGVIHFDTPAYAGSVQVTNQLSGSVLISAKVNSVQERYKAEAIMEEAGAAEVLVEQPHGEEFTALFHPHHESEDVHLQRSDDRIIKPQQDTPHEMEM